MPMGSFLRCVVDGVMVGVMLPRAGRLLQRHDSWLPGGCST